jgi:hypothetical protein
MTLKRWFYIPFGTPAPFQTLNVCTAKLFQKPMLWHFTTFNQRSGMALTGMLLFMGCMCLAFSTRTTQPVIWYFEKVRDKKAVLFCRNADYAYLPVSITYTLLWHYWKSIWK